MKQKEIRNKMLTGMGILTLFGFAFLGIFGIFGGIFISALLSIGYGIIWNDKAFVNWSTIALIVVLVCVVVFYGCLTMSGM